MSERGFAKRIRLSDRAATFRTNAGLLLRNAPDFDIQIGFGVGNFHHVFFDKIGRVELCRIDYLSASVAHDVI
jgi:hypothetical protein